MAKNIIAVIVGLIVGMAFNMGVIMLNAYVLYPMPEGTDMQNTEQMNAYIASLPVPALLVVMVAHLGQSFLGAWTAARLGATRPMLLAMIVGVLSLLGGVVNALTLETPAWFYIELPLYLLVAWIAGRMEEKRRQSAGQTA